MPTLDEKIDLFLWPFREEPFALNWEKRHERVETIFAKFFRAKLTISDEELEHRLKELDHVMTHEGVLHTVKQGDPRRTACTWSPEFLEKRPNLVEFDTIITGHLYGSKMFFKPSLAEVLAQIPDEYVMTLDAFSVTYHGMLPQPYSAHYAITTLYTER